MHHKHHVPATFIGVTIITIAILTSIGFVLFFFFRPSSTEKNQQNQQNTQQNGSVEIIDVNTASSPEEVTQAYYETMVSLKADIGSIDNEEQLFLDVTNALLSVKVPKEYLDQHLQATLKVQQIKNADTTFEEKKTALSKLFEYLET